MNFRDNIAIAIDGGGIRGVVVAHGLIELENMLGVERLADEPRLKVLVGTSTGALISACIAAGMSGAEILKLYETLGDKVFSKAGKLRPFAKTWPIISKLKVPIKLVNGVNRIPVLGNILIYALFPARYSFDPLSEVIDDVLRVYPSPNLDPTLLEFGTHIAPRTVIITATEIADRRTHFLKTTKHERYGQMKLRDALFATSSIPTYWEAIPLPPHKDDKYPRLLVDGGVGSFGNPAFAAAWEMCDPRNPDRNRQYDPNETTILSFGTGYLPYAKYREKRGDPSQWWAIDWAARALDIFGDMAIRQQSRNILFSYQGIDLHRFQLPLDKLIQADGVKEVHKELKAMGLRLQHNLRENIHALHPDESQRLDPEGIWHDFLKEYVPEE